MSTNRIKTEVAVLGSGPGGYSAAFRAADLGKQVAMIERYPRLGGVCLNVGCIPSKALLHAAQIINEAKAMGAHGIEFGEPNIDLEKLLKWKTSVVNRLTGGLKTLARQRKVQVVQGTGRFISPHEYEVTDGDGQKQVVEFEETIIAAGSRVINLPFLPDDPRIMDSTGALELEDPKGELLVLGGGIIGLEMATVYDALGAKISVVEMLDQLIPAADKDVVAPLMKWIKPRYQSIMLETKVTAVEAKPDGLWVNFEGKNAPEGPQRYDR
ncbi:MAG: dihydrolipoyl dehydrogenase, partial [bacterium]|nr:dihydrolipoyl dehydrogenase [bacterium]